MRTLSIIRVLSCAPAGRAAPTYVTSLLLAVGALQACGGYSSWDEYFLSPHIQNRQITAHCRVLTCAANCCAGGLLHIHFSMLLLPIY